MLAGFRFVERFREGLCEQSWWRQSGGLQHKLQLLPDDIIDTLKCFARAHYRLSQPGMGRRKMQALDLGTLARASSYPQVVRFLWPHRKASVQHPCVKSRSLEYKLRL